jgi:hypothetical protein
MQPQMMSEERFQQVRKRFRTLGIVGIVLLLCAITMAVCGFVLSGGPFENGGLFAVGVVGMFLIVISIFLTAMGFTFYYKRNIMSFQAQMVTPVASGMAHAMTPAITGVAQAVATGVRGAQPQQDIEAELKRLDDLLRRKVITPQEHAQMRNRVLGIG